jgi:Tol biopolymer transport system component
MADASPSTPARTEDRLESWKEIAGYLGKGVRTVVRWEKSESLPVHRHRHERRPSVFAYRSELDAWWQSRGASLELQQPTAPANTRIAWFWWAALLPVLAVGLWVLRSVPHHAASGVPLQVNPLTAYPGAQFTPNFAPDGTRFAFAWDHPGERNVDVYVQALGEAEAERLTLHPAVDFSPAWSPDGSSIAFLRRSPGRLIELFLISSSGGSERKLADVGERHFMDAPQLSWSSDGRWLAFADRDPDGPGIFAFAPETGQRRRLTRGHGPRSHLDPAFSPDGRHLAFRAGDSESHTEIYLQALGSDGMPAGAPYQLTDLRVRSTSPVWTGDGRHIFFSSGIFNTGEYAILRLQVNPGTSAPPVQVTASAGGTNFALAACWRAGLLAWTRGVSDINIWQVENIGGRWNAPQPLSQFSSTRSETEPALSPDGSQLAFISDRSGHPELWIARWDGSHLRRLTSFRSAAIAYPVWSPDGTQISLSVSSRGSYAVWKVSAAGDSLQKLIEPGWCASWSRDGRWLYYSAPSHLSPRIFRVPAAGGAPVELVDILRDAPSPAQRSRSVSSVIPRPWDVGNMSAESADGRFLFFRGEEGLWRLPLAGGRPEQVIPAMYSPFALVTGGVIFHGPPHSVTNRRALVFFRFSDGTSLEVAAPGPRGAQGLGASTDGTKVLFSQQDHVLSNLVFARGVW